MFSSRNILSFFKKTFILEIILVILNNNQQMELSDEDRNLNWNLKWSKISKNFSQWRLLYSSLFLHSQKHCSFTRRNLQGWFCWLYKTANCAAFRRLYLVRKVCTQANLMLLKKNAVVIMDTFAPFAPLGKSRRGTCPLPTSSGVPDNNNVIYVPYWGGSHLSSSDSFNVVGLKMKV